MIQSVMEELSSGIEADSLEDIDFSTPVRSLAHQESERKMKHLI